jgi:hypothetical protein
MRRISLATLLALIAALPLAAQAPDAAEEQHLVALVKEVQAQQAQLLGNQAKIEAKLAEITQTIRMARVFSARTR